MINYILDLKRLSHSRASSPCHTRTASFSQKARDILKSPDIPSYFKKVFSSNVVDGNINTNNLDQILSRQERINRGIQKMEFNIDEKLKNSELIGQVIDRKAVDRVYIKARRVTFTWQRGIKIGKFKCMLKCFHFSLIL